MKRLILTSSTIDVDDEGYAKYCCALNQTYADIYGNDYRYIQLKPIENRHISYTRIPAIYKFIELYDLILYFDDDACIIKTNCDIFDSIKIESCLTFISKDKDVLSSFGVLIDCRDKQLVKDILNAWYNEHGVDKCLSDLNVLSVWNTDSKKKDWFCHIQQDLCLNASTYFKSVRNNVAKRYVHKLLNSKNACKKTIGLVMRPQNFYSNGAGQNALFMKHALEATGHDVDIVTYGTHPLLVADYIPYEFHDGYTVDLSKYCTFLFASQIPPRDQIDKLRTKGIKCITFNPVNVVDGFHVEHFLYKEKSSTLPLFEQTFHEISDECWIIDTHKTLTMEYLSVINRNKLPILEVPQVWSPLFMEKAQAIPFYTKRDSPHVDIIILEPNMSYCKSGWIPLIIAEKFYLEHPTKVNKVYFFNTPESNPTAMGMIKSLKLAEDNKIKYMARMPINEILAFFSDRTKTNNHVVFISNQINVPYNYAYYEILYAGFPLIHNSQPLKDANLGYFYTELSHGVAGIQSAMSVFDISGQNVIAREFCAAHDPYNPDVIEKFKERLECLHPKYEYEDLTKPLVITYDNAPTDGTRYFCKTMTNNSWEYKVIGEGEKWEGWRTRMIAYVRTLERLPPKKIVVLSDARDVFCIRGSKTFIKAFESYKKPVVTSMEIFCEAYDHWREELKTHVQCMTLASYWKHHGITSPHDRKFVNNGLVAGYASDLKDIYQWMYDNNYTDDQFGLGNYVITFPDKVATDCDAKLLHTSTFGVNAGVQYIHKQANDSPTLAELNGNRAYFLHISGQANKGQKLVYEQVKMILESGLVRPCILTEAYKYNEPEFDEKF
jgi:hypothetical protein